MGCGISCQSSPKFNNHIIRVVHLNGDVEAFEHPLTVNQVTGNGDTEKEFLCTPAQLLSNYSKPLQPDTMLKPGHVYFLLPFSILQADVSPLDLASIAKKLTAKASCKMTRSPSSTTSPLLGHYEHEPVCNGNSPLSCPNMSTRARSWKPVLDTIREKSFSRSSESELQEIPD
ncbi:hypothetical protein SLEP1_g13040 [Rubroshorea leprosula]|uniref:DUF4228 domain-containing protein n=1 Tax=Rubroshorea leprosula TaxID=152421 RepID=A0AAV5IMH9_9ROSI|nr:hypothetical protein SLEP1_g13040 [Rubroshorea leprosula]